MTETNEIPVYPKLWGEEHWIVNREYCGKKLVLKKGFRCSLHQHKIKDETFYVIKGKVLMETDTGTRLLLPGDKHHIGIGQKHRYTGMQDSEIIEFSTHHRDDDSYRDVESGKVPPAEFKELLQKYTS
jgi:quercetin dioxygenase-like cupin family protein